MYLKVRTILGNQSCSKFNNSEQSTKIFTTASFKSYDEKWSKLIPLIKNKVADISTISVIFLIKIILLKTFFSYYCCN